MSQIKKTFYNIFWQNESCRNIFLLSKEELLDRTTIGDGPDAYIYTIPRIIVSNAQERDHYETIKIRTETQNINIDASIDDKIDYLSPLIEKFFSAKFQKSMDKLMYDLENNGLKVFSKMFRILLNENKWEENVIYFLQEYGFVPKNTYTFKDIENDFKKILLPNKKNELVNEQSLVILFDGLHYLKDLYVNHSYKRLYSTKQILTNTLSSDDNFTSRLKLFHLLYDSRIIKSTNEDAFIECSDCEQGTYRGTFKLKINPKKLEELKCPICRNNLTYFVPYELHNDIYEIIKSHDGLLLDVYCDALRQNNLAYTLNRKFLNDIEIDCIFESNNKVFIVESKMYKQNTTKDKLKNKLRGHFGKLLDDIQRMKELPEFQNKILTPILLTNIIDSNFIREVERELKLSNNNGGDIPKILNIELLKHQQENKEQML